MRLQSGTSNNNAVAMIALLYGIAAAQSDDLIGSVPYFIRIKKCDIFGTINLANAILITAITVPFDSRANKKEPGFGKLQHKRNSELRSRNSVARSYFCDITNAIAGSDDKMSRGTVKTITIALRDN